MFGRFRLELEAVRELAARESTDGSVKLEIFDCVGRPRDALCELDLDDGNAVAAVAANVEALREPDLDAGVVPRELDLDAAANAALRELV